MDIQGNLVAITKNAYASLIGSGGSFPGAELIGLVGLRNAYTAAKLMRGSRKHIRPTPGTKRLWRSLEIGAGRGKLAHYTARLGHKLERDCDLSLTLVEPVCEQNPALVKALSTLKANGLIQDAILEHTTFAEFLEQRCRITLEGQAAPVYDLIVLVYAYAGLLVEAQPSSPTLSAALLRALLGLLDEQGLLVMADRSISPTAPNEIAIPLKDVHKLIRLAIEVCRAARFFHVGFAELRTLMSDLLRIHHEPGWEQLEPVHQEAACRGQQLENLLRVVRHLPDVRHHVLDFGGNWLLIIWKSQAPTYRTVYSTFSRGKAIL